MCIVYCIGAPACSKYFCCLNVILGECYQKTKAVLHSALPSDALVGRVTESKVINDFLSEHLSKMVPGSMYVSGAPGTGKTAVLMKAIERIQVCSKLFDETVLSVNIVSVNVLPELHLVLSYKFLICNSY